MKKQKKEYTYILRWSKKIKAINLLGGKCQNCNEDRPWLLSFHHKESNEKNFSIGDYILYRWSKVEKEVLKCELLCEKCHREKHNQNKNTNDNKSKKILLDIKSISGCEICGYNDYIGALDFHHNKDKNFEIGKVRIYDNSCDKISEKIYKEIDKCRVLCANCHQDLHFDKEKFEKYKDEIYNWDYKETKEPLDKKLVMKLYNEGMKQIDIAKKFGRNKSVICEIIKRFNGS